MNAPVQIFAIEISNVTPEIEHDLFYWFSLFCRICEFRGEGLSAFDYTKDCLTDGRVRKFEEQISAHIEKSDEDDFSMPAQIFSELKRTLDSFCDATRISETSFLELAAWTKLIDRMFRGLGGRTPSDPNHRVHKARLRLLRNGSLFSSKDCLIVPKASTGEYGNSVNRHFLSLSYIPLDSSCEVRVQACEDIGLASLDADDPINIAIVAVVQNANELDWKFDESGTYEVSLPDRSTEKVISRTLRCLDEISGEAHLVVMPELVSNSRLNDAICAWLMKNRENGALFPIAVVAGSLLKYETGEERPRNTATLLDGEGTLQIEQHKLNKYTLKAAHHSTLNLSDADIDRDYVENIDTSPVAATLCDFPGLGRIAIVICEDLARTQPWRRILIAAGPELTLSPIMNGASEADWRWATNSAEEISNESGSTVIVANSGTMFKNDLDRIPENYAAARIPRLKNEILKWQLTKTGDSDEDGIVDWWLYRVPNPSRSPQNH